MRDDSLRAAAVLPLLVLTSLRLSAAPSGMCPITIVECDRPRSAVAGQGGLGSGACVGFTTDECGSTKIDLLDENGRAVFLPLMLSQGQTVVTACRAVADMDTSGLRLDEVRLDDPVVAAAMGGAGGGGGGGGAEPLGDLGALAGNLQDALNILGTLGGEVCVTLTDAHISSEVTQACVTATLKVGGNVIDSVPPISVGCWDDGLACHNATSCDECTTMAETMRAAGSYGGAASCGWCGTTNECVLGGTRGPRCDSCDAWTWTTATALCPSATPGGAQGEAAEHDSCVAQSMTSTPLRPSKPSSSTSSDTDCEEQDAHAGLPAVGFFAIGLLGFLGGSCCGAPVGEVMRVSTPGFPRCISRLTPLTGCSSVTGARPQAVP